MKIKTVMRRLALFAAVFLPFLAASSCNKPALGQTGGNEDFGIRFTLPEVLELMEGSLEYTFTGEKLPKYSDKIVLEASDAAFTCSVAEILNNDFKVSFPEDILPGDYTVYVSRAGSRQLVGNTQIVIVKKEDVVLENGTTVYGFVKCGSSPISGVVVSDGYNVVATDEKGFWQMKSDKANKYVFISVPSGYKVSTKGVLPLFYKHVDKKGVVERADFYLTEDSGQETHTMLFLGDMHLAGRSANDDRNQFYRFTADVNTYLSEHSGEKTYAITLGDMTWDLYWYEMHYVFQEYLNDIAGIENLQIFQTIGNHDHDMNSAGDFSTVVRYKEELGPTYYSFNIGKVHYIALDDIQCTNTGSGDRDYKSYLVQEVLDWLEKDLSYVPKNMPLVITMHAPLYNDNGTESLKNASALLKIIDGYSEVHFVTGHTHKVYNVDKLGSNKIYEHNSGAVCATWWWTGKLSGIHLCQDGAPGGYRIMEVNGTDFKWQFKPTGKSPNVQFRVYDRNAIDLTASKWLNTDVSSAEIKQYYTSQTSQWAGASSDNYVYINVWDYDPSWQIEVTENGKSLKVDKVSAYDPLHIISYIVPGLNKNSSKGFGTRSASHFFRVKASSATSTLSVKVTDRFGRTYAETVERPKEFSINAYK